MNEGSRLSNSTASIETKPAAELPFGVKAGWGIGTLCVAIGFTAQNMLVLRFMTDFVGIGAALAALLIAGSKIYDAFTDPLMGVISDRTNSRFGRRRPYLLLGGVLLTASMLAVFHVPIEASDSVRIVYMCGALVLFATAYTIFNVPYLAMPAEMTTSYHQRSDLMSYRIVALAVAGILSSFVGLKMIAHYGGGVLGHQMMSYVMAPIILVASLICFYTTSRAPFTTRPAGKTIGIWEQIKLASKNRPFFLLLAIKFCTLMNLGVASISPFFFTYILEISYAYLATFALCAQITLMLSQYVWLRISRAIGKRNAYQLALAAAMIVPFSWLFASVGEPEWQIYLRGVIGGFATGGALLMGQSLLPDTIEYDYLKTGLRREGIFSGLYTTMEKLASAVGVAVIGAFLGFMGYQASTAGEVVQQTESAILAIYICIGVVPIVIDLVCLLILTRYKLSEEKLTRLREESPHSDLTPQQTS